MSTIKTTRKYKAFISYKHSEIGRKHAIALEVALKGYAKPILSRPPKIFRDEKHMVPSNDLSKLITSGLEESEYLIFIAENGAATSKWCCDELEYWCGTLGRKENLIILHAADSIHLDIANNKVDWEQTTALPPLLEKYISSIPLYVDVHQLQEPHELALEHPQYNSIINLISAKLRGIAPEELNDEALRVHRKNLRLRNWAIGILSLMLLVSIWASVFAFYKQKEAVASAQLAIKNAEKAEASAQEARDSSEVAKQQRAYADASAKEARDSAEVAKRQRAFAVLQQGIAEANEILAEENAQVAKDNLVKANRRFASYLVSEADKARNNEDIRLAFRLTEIAHKYDRNNESVLALKEQLPSYAAQFTLEGKNYQLSPDSQYFTFTTILEDSSTALTLMKVGSNSSPITFKNSSIYHYRYNPKGEYLTFYTKGTKGKYSTFNVYNLKSNTLSHTIENSSSNQKNYKSSPDGKHLALFTKGIDGKYSTLNLLTLGSNSIPITFENSINESYKFSLDGKYLIFYTKGKDKKYSKLNILTLDNSSPFLTFENCHRYKERLSNRDSYKYSPYGNYVFFYTKDSDEKYSPYSTLNVVTLGIDSPPRVFKDSYIGDDDLDFSYRYSSDGRYLLFYTLEKSRSIHSTLNVLNLDDDGPPRIYENSNDYWFSPDGKHLTFYTTGKDKKYSTLNVLELGGDFSLYSFKDIDLDNVIYIQEGKYLIFFTEGVYKGFGTYTTLNILELETGSISYIFEDTYKESYSFNTEGKSFAFYTKGKGEHNNINILTLGNNSPPVVFEKVYYNPFGSIYNSDGKYITFFTKGKDGEYSTLNVFRVGVNSSLRSFEDCNPNSYRCSPDGKYLTFYTKDSKNKYSILNVFTLGENASPRTFRNSYEDTFGVRYSPDEKNLLFYTIGKDGEYSTLNVLKLESNSLPITFENSFTDNKIKSYHYSIGGKYLAFITKGKDGVFEVHFLDLKLSKVIRTTVHKFIPKLKSLNENIFLTESTNPKTTNKIYKIIDLSLGGTLQAFEYYKENFYLPLDEDEKKEYRIID